MPTRSRRAEWPEVPHSAVLPAGLSRPGHRAHHRQDARSHRLGQLRPSLDHIPQIGVNWGQLCAKCATFCAALVGNCHFFRGNRPLFESLPDYSLYAVNIVVNLVSANWEILNGMTNWNTFRGIGDIDVPLYRRRRVDPLSSYLPIHGEYSVRLICYKCGGKFQP